MRGLRWSAAVAGAFVAAAIVGASAQAPAGRPRITGIDHVVLRASDAFAARRHYGETLGLEEAASEPAAPGRGSRLRFLVGGRQAIFIDADLPAGEDERLRTVAFATPDLADLAAQLAAKGLSVVRVPGPPPSLTVKDPDGHLLTFVERAWPPEEHALIAPWPRALMRWAPPLSTRILHVGLTVRDEAAANRFYKDVLGFGEIWRGGRAEGATDWVNLRVPDGTDYLEYMLVTAAPTREQLGVLHHVALVVPDIQTAWEAVGARINATTRTRAGPPNVGRNGRWQLNLYDADGTRTELMEPFTVR